MEGQERGGWHCEATLFKYKEDIAPYEKKRQEALFHKKFHPYEIIKMEGNCLLNTGINQMWGLITGALTGTTNIYAEANAQTGVGNSTLAAAATQTGLQGGTATTWKAMEAGFPTYGTQSVTFKSSYSDAEANYAWAEWGVRNLGSSVSLNRKVEALGTKTSGTWTLETKITLS